MNFTQEQLVENALIFYNRGDFSLGYRTLLDAALNTESEEVFIKILDFVNVYESKKDTEKASLLTLFKECCVKVDAIKIETNNVFGETILSAKNITKNYNNGRFVLGPVDVTLKKGDIFGLVGENGNGKTTLLTVLASLNAYSSGSLNYSFSETIKDEYEVLSKLVYIPQRTPTWYGKVLDNLKFALVHYGIKGTKNELLVLMMVARFGLWKYKDLKWSELSSGYKMRFELARTMLRRPEIILLDEPLANLDILAQQIILEDLRMMSKSPVNPIAMVFSSQQLYEVEKISDQVIYLRNGKPTNDLNVEEETKKSLILELDAKNSREELEIVFNSLNLEKLDFNGGVYILYFKNTVSFNAVLMAIAKNELKVDYIRDISNSTRRFFVY